MLNAEDEWSRRIAGQAHSDLLVLERTLNDKGKLRQDIAVEDVRRYYQTFKSIGLKIDATLTRIRTSVGLGDGIGTVRISVLFGAGFDFTAAFIVDAIPKSPGRVRSWTLGISTFYHSPGPVPQSGFLDKRLSRSALDRM